MFHARTLLICVALIGALAACATKPQPQVQGIQKIGIVSTLGYRLNFQKQTLLIFGNKSDEADISRWGIARFVEKQLAHELKERYSIAPVSVDPEIVRDGKSSVELVVVGDQTKRSGNFLDAYLVIVPKEGSVYMGGYSYMPINGLFLHQRSMPLLMNTTIYASADLVLIDGKSLEELRRVPLQIDEGFWGKEVDGISMAANSVMVDLKTDWPDQLENLSKAQIKKLRHTYAALLRESIKDSVVRAGLL